MDPLFEAMDRVTRSSPPFKLSPSTNAGGPLQSTGINLQNQEQGKRERFKWQGLPDQPCREEYRTINRNLGNAIERPKRIMGMNFLFLDFHIAHIVMHSGFS